MNANAPLDFGAYVANVVGPRRIATMFDMTPADWMQSLTPTMIRKIKAYPHGIVNERIFEAPYAGGFVARRSVTCACGKKFTARTLSEVYEMHSAHSGVATPSRNITADLLEM